MILSNRFFACVCMCVWTTICLAVPFFVAAQNTSALPVVPAALKTTCLLTAEGYVDSCPSQRETIRTINQAMQPVFAQFEKTQSSVAGIRMITDRLKSVLQEKRKSLLLAQVNDPVANLALGYMTYLIDLYTRELTSTINFSETSRILFTKTYFLADQSGLQPVGVALYKAEFLAVKSEKLPLSLTVRNFADHAITDMVDGYCFATIGNEDVMIPLNFGSPALKANSITTLVVVATIPSSSLLTQLPGSKDLHCMVTYRDAGVVKKSDFVSFSVRIEE